MSELGAGVYLADPNAEIDRLRAARNYWREQIKGLVKRNQRLEAERAELMAFAESESKDWHGRNADRYWEVQRFLARLRAAQPAKEDER